MNPEDNLHALAQYLEEQGDSMRARWCRGAANEIGLLAEQLSYFRKKVDTQTRMRLDAQARAGRIARDARR